MVERGFDGLLPEQKESCVKLIVYDELINKS